MFAESIRTEHKLYWIFFIVPTCIAYITAFYMMRCWTLTFAGKPRNHHCTTTHREPGAVDSAGGPRDPLQSLPAAGIGIQSMLRNYHPGDKVYVSATTSASSPVLIRPSSIHCRVKLEHSAARRRHMWKSEALEHAHHLVVNFVTPAFIVGIGLAFLIYRKGYQYTDKIMQLAPFRAMHTFLYNRRCTSTSCTTRCLSAALA